MAFAGIGDAILYSVLPVYANELAIPVFWVGILLSVNRFTRVIANPWIANQIRRIGIRPMMIISSGIAVLTSLMYGMSLGIVTFLVIRILWGLAYSAMKSVTLRVAGMYEKSKGFAFGISQSIKSLGTLIAFLMGPYIINLFGVSTGFLIIGLLSVVAILFALRLYNYHVLEEKVSYQQVFSLSSINLLVFIISFSVDGILVVILAFVFRPFAIDNGELLLIVSNFILLNRLFLVFVSLAGGFISKRYSILKLFRFAVILVIIGFGCVFFDQLIVGVIVIFLGNAFVISFAPALSISEYNQLQFISSVSTWWDLGAGIGALVGITMIQLLGQPSLILTVITFVVVLFFNFIIQNAYTNRQFV